MGRFHEYELPGEDLVLKGLDDLANGRESIESLLVAIGAPRLRRLKLAIPFPAYSEFPEKRLHRFLEALDEASAHAKFNSYLRRLVSFEKALENLPKV